MCAGALGPPGVWSPGSSSARGQPCVPGWRTRATANQMRITCKRVAHAALSYIRLNRHRSLACIGGRRGRACRLNARLRHRRASATPRGPKAPRLPARCYCLRDPADTASIHLEANAPPPQSAPERRSGAPATARCPAPAAGTRDGPDRGDVDSLFRGKGLD
jgi:hypothetical protein